MKILRGFVVGVVKKGTEEKPWAMVGINAVSLDRDGFEQNSLVKFMVAGQQYKDGLQNAYRQQIGAEVFAPYADEIDEYNGKSRIRYNLQGVPLRLMEQPAVSAPAASQPALKQT
jgi:hypothetical protein